MFSWADLEIIARECNENSMNLAFRSICKSTPSPPLISSRKNMHVMSVNSYCRMLKFPGMRPTAEVVGILSQSVRRQQVVGIVKQEHKGDVLSLIPADPRLPHMMVNAASMPFELRQQLQVHQLDCVDRPLHACVHASRLTACCMLYLLLFWDAVRQ